MHVPGCRQVTPRGRRRDGGTVGVEPPPPLDDPGNCPMPARGPRCRRFALILVATALSSALPTRRAGCQTVEHVLVVGLDGCRPEAIRRAGGPVLTALWKGGAACWD